MEVAGEQVILLSADQLREINKVMCKEFGGLWVPPDNLRSEGSLEFLLDRLGGSVFGAEPPSNVFEVAATLVASIIHGHYFNDGNKRTALLAAWELLAVNGVALHLADQGAESFAVDVADHKLDNDSIERWLRDNCDL